MLLLLSSFLSVSRPPVRSGGRFWGTLLNFLPGCAARETIDVDLKRFHIARKKALRELDGRRDQSRLVSDQSHFIRHIVSANFPVVDSNPLVRGQAGCFDRLSVGVGICDVLT